MKGRTIAGNAVAGIVYLVFLLLLTSPQVLAQEKANYLRGYTGDIRGEILSYHSPEPGAKDALLVRSENENHYIEWETEAIPENWKGKTATFIWISGIDVNKDSHAFHLFLNGRHYFSFRNPLSTDQPDWKRESDDGVWLEYRNVLIDRHDDLMGYMFLTVPLSKFPKGKPVRITVKGESAGSRSWYMAFRYGPEQKVTLTAEPAVSREGNRQYQWLRLDVITLSERGKAEVKIAGETIGEDLSLGLNRFRVKVPRVTAPTSFPVEVTINGRLFAMEDFLFRPVSEKTIYLIHHSHNDIGYTHVQTEVEQAQWSFLEECIELAGNSRDYPESSRFRWNVEVMWAVESYLRHASVEKKEAFVQAVRDGWIELDGLFGNELTGLCRPEELMQLMEASRKAGAACGVRIESAMISDVPGFTWGLIPVMAQYGIRYFSVGTNHSHRIGNIIEAWGDRPFYWVSPSGREKVLCWIHQKGYAFFHTGLGYTRLQNKLKPEEIFQYIEELDGRDYPYDIIPFRYNIGSDNGPPDPVLPQTVREWNEKYVTPKLVISTVSEAFREFEKRYGHEIPVYRGDLTPYWEDGAASSAAETALNRASAERLVQAEILWTLIDPGSFPEEKFEDAWRNVLLYDEHTWGSWNSISEPEADFTLRQWEIKQSFALDAAKAATELLESALAARTSAGKEATEIEVFNTCSWKRSDLVILPAETDLAGETVTDARGERVPSQRLSTGEFAFLATDVPPLASARFFLAGGKTGDKSNLLAGNHSITDGIISVTIDPATGTISELRKEGIPVNLADTGSKGGLNDYFYVSGRDPGSPRKSSKPAISIKESGPLITSLLIESEAPGCHMLTREIRLVKGLGRVDIINTLDKKNIYDQEGVHLAFPFHIPEGKPVMDIAWGTYEPEKDQLPGSCKNYFTVQRWVDISNRDYGVTWVTPDAPLVELGEITADPIAYGWVRNVRPAQTIYSYVMNNYWETNYKASQEGPVTFRYSILPHRAYQPGEAERNGTGIAQPLIAIVSNGETGPVTPIVQLHTPGIILTSMKPSEDGKAVMLRLFNAGGIPCDPGLEWTGSHTGIFISSPLQEKGLPLPEKFTMMPWEIVTIRLEK